jgi:hypothetical protein
MGNIGGEQVKKRASFSRKGAKSETRNPKSETNPKSENEMTKSRSTSVFSGFEF